jgi:chemotaxis protein methyltransferase CheR
MRLSDFDLYRDLLKSQSGMAISPDKSYLLDSRLTPVARKWGYVSLESMTMALRGVPDPDLVRDVTEAMSIYDTSFFKDRKPFASMQNMIIPFLQKNRKRRHHLRIWCNGCSTGQEAFSVAMLLKDNEDLFRTWTVEILATDISTRALKKAERASYSQFDVQKGLPIRKLIKYFEKDGENWRVKEDVREIVEFDFFNLLDDMKLMGDFDIILCRNVISYFDLETKKNVLDRMALQLEDDGFLLLGSEETTEHASEVYKQVSDNPGLFVKKTNNIEKAKQFKKAMA